MSIIKFIQIEKVIGVELKLLNYLPKYTLEPL